MAKLSINLLTFNAEKYLDACLESVRCQNFRDFKILVIDNASKDRTREKISEWEKIFEGEGIEFRNIYNEENLGFAEGHNAGFKFQMTNYKFQKLKPPFPVIHERRDTVSPFAKGGNSGISGAVSAMDCDVCDETPQSSPRDCGGENEIFTHPNPSQEGSVKYICCLNQDIILQPDYLQKIVSFMDDDYPECGAASGKLMRIMKDELFFDILNANGCEYESPSRTRRAEADESTRKIPPAPFFKGGENTPLTPLKREDAIKTPFPCHSRTTGHGVPLCKRGKQLDYERLSRECRVIDSMGIGMFKSHRAVEIGQGEEDSGKYTEIKEVFGVSGTAPVYRMEALEDVKLESPTTHSPSSGRRRKTHPLPLSRGEKMYEYFDKDFGSYKEDVDLAYRLRWRGWKSYVVLEAVAYHKRGARQLKSKTDDFNAALNRKNKPKYINYLSQRNHIWTLVKNMDTLNLSTVWYEAKKFGYEMIFEWSTFKAWFDVWEKMGVMREKRKWIMGNRKVSKEEIERWME